MIIVTGHAIARNDTVQEVQQLALAHVLRSRTEHGCVSHAVSRDVEEPMKFVFVERWSDMHALQAHFCLHASRQFARDLTALCDAPPQMAIYSAEEIRVG